jgi:hypothetical protein
MSMELFVILALTRAPTADAWQKALIERHVPVQFSESLDLARHSGFVPLTVQGQRSGFYFLNESYAELREHYPVLANIKLERPVVYSLGYGGHMLECASAFYAASALVAQFGGVAFEPQGRVFMTEEQLVNAASQCERLAGAE